MSMISTVSTMLENLGRPAELRITFTRDNPNEPHFTTRFTLSETSEEEVGKFLIPIDPSSVERVLFSAASLSQPWIQRGDPVGSSDFVREVGAQLFSALFQGRAESMYRRLEKGKYLSSL